MIYLRPTSLHTHFLSLWLWQAVNEKLIVLKKSLDEGDQGALKEIRETLLGLVAPTELVCSYCLSLENHLLLLHISNLGSIVFFTTHATNHNILHSDPKALFFNLMLCQQIILLLVYAYLLRFYLIRRIKL